MKNQLKPITRAVGQSLGFPVNSHQFYQGHLYESLKHGHSYLEMRNHGESDTKNITRKSPQCKQSSGREDRCMIKAWLTCHTPLKLQKINAVNLRILSKSPTSLSAYAFHKCQIHQAPSPRKEHSPERWGMRRRLGKPSRIVGGHLTSAPLKME